MLKKCDESSTSVLKAKADGLKNLANNSVKKFSMILRKICIIAGASLWNSKLIMLNAGIKMLRNNNWNFVTDKFSKLFFKFNKWWGTFFFFITENFLKPPNCSRKQVITSPIENHWVEPITILWFYTSAMFWNFFWSNNRHLLKNLLYQIVALSQQAVLWERCLLNKVASTTMYEYFVISFMNKRTNFFGLA